MLTNQEKKTVITTEKVATHLSQQSVLFFLLLQKAFEVVDMHLCLCQSPCSLMVLLSSLSRKPLALQHLQKLLVDSSRAFRVCFWVSIRSSISSRVFRRRNSSLACRSCSVCSLWKFSSVSSATQGSPVLLLLSCSNSWFRSLWIRNSSWRAWTVICMCWYKDKKENPNELSSSSSRNKADYGEWESSYHSSQNPAFSKWGFTLFCFTLSLKLIEIICKMSVI